MSKKKLPIKATEGYYTKIWLLSQRGSSLIFDFFLQKHKRITIVGLVLQKMNQAFIDGDATSSSFYPHRSILSHAATKIVASTLQ
jgi:hypothetical protein